MLRIVNPFYVSPVQEKINQHRAAVQAWIQGQPQNRIITMAALRAGLPAIAADLSRAVVNAICVGIGATIENPEDSDL